MRDCIVPAIIIAILGFVMGYFFSLQVLFLVTIVGAIFFIVNWRDSKDDLTPLSFLFMAAVVINSDVDCLSFCRRPRQSFFSVSWSFFPNVHFKALKIFLFTRDCH